MASLSVDITSPSSIDACIQEIEALKVLIEWKAEEAVSMCVDVATATIEERTPYISGDYARAHHVDVDGTHAKLWNDVSAITVYDDMPHNNLRLRMSYHNLWVGRRYASAIEFGYEAGWPLWAHHEPYRPYSAALDDIYEMAIPAIREGFVLE